MRKEGERVLPEAPEAATLQTVTGWVSRHGMFYGQDEKLARWAGATHVHCARCQSVTDKNYTLCNGCRSIAEHERHAKLPRAPWDGKCMLYCGSNDRYYASPDEIDEEFSDDLMIVLCKPNLAGPLDSSQWADDLPDEGNDETPGWLAEAIDAFNKAIEGQPPLSWSPSKVAWDGTTKETT